MSDLDADVMRPPESSDDEQDLALTKSDSPHPSSSPPSPKRKRESTRPTRASKKPKLQNDAGIDPVPEKPQGPPVASQNTEMTDMLFSQSSQNKRGKYVSRHKAQMGVDRPARQTLRDRGRRIDLTDVKERDPSPPQKARAFEADDTFVQQEDNILAQPLTFVPLPDNEEMDSSASTSATKLYTFEETPEPEGPAISSKLLSSPPTSPEVVDIDDIPEEVTQQEPEPAVFACPVCHKDIDRTTLPAAEKAPRLLPMKKQQEFCRRHRSYEAESVRMERNYPIIDWQVLSLERIPNQIPHLRKVLRRKAKCYYLEKLEANVAKAKGNRKAIREYLTEGVLDVAKAGYYGPKGTGVMMDSVTSELSKDLTKLLSDKLVRSVGMGGYVTAVLVPELTLRLVMDDMNILDEAAARKVLDDSNEIGLLLNPDDDHIEQYVTE